MSEALLDTIASFNVGGVTIFKSSEITIGTANLPLNLAIYSQVRQDEIKKLKILECENEKLNEINTFTLTW